MDRGVDRVEGIQVAYIGGGSRGWAWSFLKDLARDGQIEGHIRLYDINRPAAERNKLIGEQIMAHPEALAHWSLSVADDLASALTGADFVVISILPGTMDEMRVDVHAPERYGIWQSVGDTVGPGGFIRALRTVPMFATIAEAIRDNSPDAWVINYTNPMSVCVGTLYDVFPGIKAFGCCHEVFGAQQMLADMLKADAGIDAQRTDISVNVLGINHFTWLNRVSYGTLDLMPMFARFAQSHYESGFGEAGESWVGAFFSCNHRVKFDLFRRYGLIAAAGDRHLAEFMPPWYLRDPETVERWGFRLTPVDYRVDEQKKRDEKSLRLASGEELVTLEKSGEEGHLLMKALLGLTEMVSNVNLPNAGQIENLPRGAIVETNALFRRDSIQPVIAGAMPDNLLPLVQRHVSNQRNTIRAARTRDRALAVSTFLNDPLVTVGAEVGENLMDEMLAGTAKYHGWVDGR